MADYTLSAKITGDSSGFEKAFSTAQKAVDNLQKKIPNTFKGASNQASKSLSEIAAESGKTVNEIRSDVMKAAAEYEKAGMTKSEAMKKAYADIGYSAEEANKKSKMALGDTEDTLDGVAQKAISVGDKLKSIGDKFVSAGKKISSVGDSLTNKITKPALAAGTALAGITLVKGWNRLTGIDDARAKLQGLGHDAESVETIMDSALASVKGTSFGLDEAATTAANAVAAGIKPGQELTKYLRMTADAAAIAGTSMSEMGSIINKVQTGQTVYTEDLEQLADRGLPVYQWIAEEAGIAASEVKQLASDGQISSQMLYSAIEKNIGGAAQIIGETSFSAALDNIGASISRIGANFLDAGGQGGGFFSQLKPLMADFSESLGELENKASELGAKFGAAFANVVQKAREMKARFDALPESVQSLLVKASGIGAAVAVGIGPVLTVIGAMTAGFGTMAKVIAAVASPIGLVLTAIAGLTAGFAYLMQTNEAFRATVMTAWDAIGEKAATALASIQEKAIPIVDGIKEKIGSIRESFSTFDFGTLFDSISSAGQKMYETVSNIFSGLNVPVALFATGFAAILAKAGTPIGAFVSKVASIGSGLIAGIGNTIPKILPALTGFFAKFQTGGGIIGLFKTGISSLGGAISGLFSPVTLIVGAIALVVSGFATLMATNEEFRNTIIGLGQNIISGLLPAFQMILQTAGQIASTVMPVLINMFNQILPIIGQIVIVIMQIAEALAPMISQLVSTLLPVITNIVTVVMNIISAVMPALIAILNAVMSVIQTFAPVIMDILSIVISVVSNIIATISPIISFIGMVISSIMAVISPIITFVANIIATIVQVIGTIIGTVTEIFSTVYSIISGVWSNVSNFISTAINGISSVISTLTGVVGGVFNGIYSTVSSVMGNVRNFITGVFNGIRSAWSGLTGFVSGVFSGVASAVQTLVSQVKGFVNGVIGGINSAISVINMIPGVSIGSIPYLAHGTENWQGGFAYMNEGGRGELTYLPNGAQVIPHDISVKYAKESARANSANTSGAEIDYDRLISGLVSAISGVKVEHVSTFNGRVLSRELMPLLNSDFGRQQTREAMT